MVCKELPVLKEHEKRHDTHKAYPTVAANSTLVPHLRVRNRELM